MSGRGERADKVMDAIVALLRLRADRAGIAAVAVSDLAGSLAYSDRTIQRYLRTLEESGRLQPLSSSGGRGQVTRWQIPVEKGDILARIGPEKGDILEGSESVTLFASANPSESVESGISGSGEWVTSSRGPEGVQPPLFPPHPPIPPLKPSPPPSSEVDPAIAGAARAAGGDRRRNLPPQNRYVQRVYAIYREVGVVEPPPSAVGQWARMVGEEPLLKLLAELAGQGHLKGVEKPQAYVHRAVVNLAETPKRPAPGNGSRVVQAARLKAARTVRTREDGA